MITVETEIGLRRTAQQTREIYFLQATTLGLIKIGVADNAAKRARDLALASPDALRVLGVMICHNHGRLEADVHARFAHLRKHGEWFSPGEDLLDYIENFAAFNRARMRRIEAYLTMPTLPIGRPKKARAELIKTVRCTTTSKTDLNNSG